MLDGRFDPDFYQSLLADQALARDIARQLDKDGVTPAERRAMETLLVAVLGARGVLVGGQMS